MKTLMLYGALLLSISAFAAKATPGRFLYSQAKNQCLNEKMVRGFNAFDFDKIKDSLQKEKDELGNEVWVYESVNLECMDLTNVFFSLPNNSDYLTLRNWNLRGSQLVGAKFNFAILINADFSGARAKGLVLPGYAWAYIKSDVHSTLPSRCHPISKVNGVIQVNDMAKPWQKEVASFSNQACD